MAKIEKEFVVIFPLGLEEGKEAAIALEKAKLAMKKKKKKLKVNDGTLIQLDTLPGGIPQLDQLKRFY